MSSELIVVRAADEAALVAELERIVAYLDRVPDVPLADVACTCLDTAGDSVLSAVASDVASLRARLASAARRLATGRAAQIRDKSGTYYFRDHLLGADRGKLAFVYSGVMSFYPDMLRDLVIESPVCRDVFDVLEEALAGEAEFTPSSFVFPPAPYYRHDADIFKSGAYAQALVATCSGCLALTKILCDAGLRPDGVVGCAGGDLAAMICSGAAGTAPDRTSRIRILQDIYRIVRKAVNHGGMPAVATYTLLTRRPEELDATVAGLDGSKAFLALDFSPRQKTYVVLPDYEETFVATVAANGVRAMKLALDRPFNTPLCESLVPAIRKFTDEWMRQDPVCEVWSCATAAPLPPRTRAARKETAARWATCANFAETVRRMHAAGYRVFLEVGPRGLMTASVADTLRGVDHAAIAVNSIHRRGVLQLFHAVGQLLALGAAIDVAPYYAWRGARKLDFSSSLSPEVRRNAEMKLSRAFPRLTLLGGADALDGASFLAEPKGRGAKAAARAAAVAQKARRQRQFDFGAMNPLVSDADSVASIPGVMQEVVKVFRLADVPFVGDYARGTNQVSYTYAGLKGLVVLTPSLAAEIMGEVAAMVVPNRTLVRIEDLNCRRMVSFEREELKLFVRAERVSPKAPGESAVMVQIRDDAPNSAYTWPLMEATVVLADALPPARPVAVTAHSKPRSVHWSGRDIYPQRLSCGPRLHGIRFVEIWSESGIDYEVAVPPLADNVAFTRFPVWAVNPLLLEIVTSGFSLWRSHERFAGASSFPFRFRRIVLSGAIPEEGGRLKCYLRLTGVTPKSQLCDISVTDGNGNELMSVSGWEELTERVPPEYRAIILQPGVNYLTQPLGREVVGDPLTDIASAGITDVPYPLFERNEGLWLKLLSHIVLDADERRDFQEMTGSVPRRTEWLFGRIAAKEAVRRYLHDVFQARWSSADIHIWADDSGKPHALGKWNDYLVEKIDIAIAHTAQFVVALAAANARVGVDVESVSRDLSEEFAAGVFTPEEQELAAQAANASQATIKFWCAKEAVSKALGTGIRYSPKEMTVTEFLADTGVLKVRLGGAWVEAFKNFKGRDIDVTVRTVRDHALASCFIPSSLFEV